MMRNPFLTVRFVLFALIAYLNVMTFGFSIWNIVSMKAAPVLFSGAPIFVLFNSCATIFSLFLALAELAIPSAKTAQVNFECGWTCVMSILQFGASMDITVMGPPAYCSSQAAEAVCASATALMMLTWISCTCLLLYFLTLLITAFSHASTYPAIWSASVYSIPWFMEKELQVHSGSTLRPLSLKAPPKAFKLGTPDTPAIFRGLDSAPLSPPRAPFADEEKGSTYSGKHYSFAHEMSRETYRPTWAKSIKLTRGRDHPFALPSARPLTTMFKSVLRGSAADAPPPPPPKAAHSGAPRLDVSFESESHYNEDSQRSQARSSYSHFPEGVADPDQPIEFRRLSEWVRADMAAGINVHSTPRSTGALS
ncbi:hypothetical protein K474DRAFT_21327 [Panus rudis PR-1116 ss-1]|nr:hypothetical protein K474DRAFT_21327 [Panus rudis PR-1116 ss-1]